MSEPQNKTKANRKRTKTPSAVGLSETLDMRQLRYFVEVARLGSMSSAARACGMSQPGMSLRMAELETRMGEQLLRRGSKGVVLTEAGRVLQHHAERILLEESRLREQFSAREDLQAGHVAFGLIPTLAPYLLPLMLAEFRSEYPDIEIEVVESQTSILIERIGAGELEFAILSDVTSADQRRYGLQTRELFREPLLLAVPHQHELAQKEEDPVPANLNPKEIIHLSDGHCLRDQVLKVCRLESVERNLQCDQLDTALAMVSANLGVSLIPKLAVRRELQDRVTIRSFRKPWPTRTIYLLKKKGVKLSKASEKLVKVLQGESM